MRSEGLEFVKGWEEARSGAVKTTVPRSITHKVMKDRQMEGVESQLWKPRPVEIKGLG